MPVEFSRLNPPPPPYIFYPSNSSSFIYHLNTLHSANHHMLIITFRFAVREKLRLFLFLFLHFTEVAITYSCHYHSLKPCPSPFQSPHQAQMLSWWKELRTDHQQSEICILGLLLAPHVSKSFNIFELHFTFHMELV